MKFRPSIWVAVPAFAFVIACGPSARNPNGGGPDGGSNGSNCVDEDGDGWTTCDGDCCDNTMECANPAQVNPGAYDVPGDGADNDCDGQIDNAVAACDTGLSSDSSTAADYAKAIDICQTTTMDDPMKKWGLISAVFTKADGSSQLDSAQSVQHSIRAHYGSNAAMKPHAGASLIELSTGNAAATGDTNPGPDFDEDGENGAMSDFPADFLAANNGTLPNAPGCDPPDLTGGAGDPIMLTLTIRVPTNASSFSMDINFFSSEFPEWTCTEFNDFFVVLLDSSWNGMPANPTDKNLALYTAPDMKTYPVGVNLAAGNTGLFTQCKNGTIGCDGDVSNLKISTCSGTADLTGTGMDATDDLGGGCSGGDNEIGGATGWLTTSGNVTPGEIMKLRIAIWDTSDDALDSLAVIDNFKWSAAPSTPGTVIE